VCADAAISGARHRSLERLLGPDQAMSGGAAASGASSPLDAADSPPAGENGDKTGAEGVRTVQEDLLDWGERSDDDDEGDEEDEGDDGEEMGEGSDPARRNRGLKILINAHRCRLSTPRCIRVYMPLPPDTLRANRRPHLRHSIGEGYLPVLNRAAQQTTLTHTNNLPMQVELMG
jgi:hypothetical protein